MATRSTKREHEPGKVNRPTSRYGKAWMRCSCGKRITSTNTFTDDGTWSAFRQHVDRAQKAAHKAAEEARLANVRLLTEEIAKSALHAARLSTPVELEKLEDGLRLTLLELEER